MRRLIVAVLLTLIASPALGQTARVDSVAVDPDLRDEWFHTWQDTTSLEHGWCAYGTAHQQPSGWQVHLREHFKVPMKQKDANTSESSACPSRLEGKPPVAFVHTHPGPRHIYYALPDSLVARALTYRAKHYGSGFECDLSDQDRSEQSRLGLPVVIVVCADDTYAWLDLYGARHEEPPIVVGDLADDSDWNAPHEGFVVDSIPEDHDR